MLSEKTQVAYDRIMCEHMRNICITQQQLKFFTKRLTEEEKEELKLILHKVNGGFHIPWVAESINKRRAYGESRRKNRTNDVLTHDEHMLTYDEHMENENENDIINDIDKGGLGEKEELSIPTLEHVKEYFKSKGYTKESATQAFNHYETLNWHDKDGKPVLNWKNKMVNVWFKPENKDPNLTETGKVKLSA